MSVDQPLEPLLLSVKDACAAVACSRQTLYKLLRSGALQAVKAGGRTLITAEALRTYASNLPRYEAKPKKPPLAKPTAAPIYPAPQKDRMLRAKAVMARTGLARTTIYMRSAAGTFPPRISLGGRISGWRESEVEAWLTDPANYRANPSGTL